MNSAPDQPETPLSFGYKNAWIALRTMDPDAVTEALKLIHVRRSNWRHGIAAAYGGSVFVTPPIDGWVLAVSGEFPCPDTTSSSSRDPCTRFLLTVARWFPEIQFFATHRVSMIHAWARLLHGQIVRQYAYYEEMIWNTGPPDAEERRMYEEQEEEERAWAAEDAQDSAAAEAQTVPPSMDKGGFVPTESSVMRMAGVWSIDPSQLQARRLEPSVGYLGTLSNTKP